MQKTTIESERLILCQRFAEWLWQKQSIIWGVIIFGIAINVGTDWLVDKEFDLRGTPLGWLLNHAWLFLGGITLLCGQTIFAWWGHTNLGPDCIDHPTIVDKTSRKGMVDALKKAYINELQASIQGIARIPLQIVERFDLPHPQRPGSWHAPQPARFYPKEMEISEIYDHAGRGLLILGEPGAGKTTLLYELAQTLLHRAEEQEIYPIPILLNLSSWGTEELPFRQWLIQELTLRYLIPQRLGVRWLEEQSFLFLFDGLDEVQQDARPACLVALNRFLLEQNHPLVISSRREEYEAEKQRLLIQSTVQIQPLMTSQVKSYLKNAGKPLGGVRQILRTNPNLLDLLTTPLMLSVVALAYQGNKTITDLQQDSTLATQQHHIFARYLQRMLSSNSTTRRLPGERLQSSLIWLAHQMHTRSQSIFYLEQIQPDWLERPWAKRIYHWLGICLPAFFISISITTLILILFMQVGKIYTSLLLGILIGWWQSETSIRSEQTICLCPHPRRQAILICLIGGVTLGWFIHLTGNNVFQFFVSTFFAFICMILTWLFTPYHRYRRWQIYRQTEQEGKPMPWQAHPYAREAIWIGLLLGLCYFLGNWINSPGTSYWYYRMISHIGDILKYGLSFSLISLLVNNILYHIGTSVKVVEYLKWSGRSIWEQLSSPHHLRTTVFLGIGFIFFFLFSQELGHILDMITADTFDQPRLPHMFSLSFNLGLNLLFREILAGAINGFSLALGYGLSYGLSMSFCYWLLLGIFQGIRTAQYPKRAPSRPNWGIRRSLINGSLLAITIGIFCCLVGSFMLTLNRFLEKIIFTCQIGGNISNVILKPSSYSLFINLLFAILIGIASGILVFLLRGGLAWWRHWLIRTLLWQNGVLPWRCSNFLNEATQRILLFRVGRGGYRFIHDLFQDYLSHQYIVPNTPKAHFSASEPTSLNTEELTPMH